MQNSEQMLLLLKFFMVSLVAQIVKRTSHKLQKVTIAEDSQDLHRF